MADRAATRYVIPTVNDDGLVICECRRQMVLVNYVSYPGQHRWQFYRCLGDPGHVTHALPLDVRPPLKATL